MSPFSVSTVPRFAYIHSDRVAKVDPGFTVNQSSQERLSFSRSVDIPTYFRTSSAGSSFTDTLIGILSSSSPDHSSESVTFTDTGARAESAFAVASACTSSFTFTSMPGGRGSVT